MLWRIFIFSWNSNHLFSNTEEFQTKKMRLGQIYWSKRWNYSNLVRVHFFNDKVGIYPKRKFICQCIKKQISCFKTVRRLFKAGKYFPKAKVKIDLAVNLEEHPEWNSKLFSWVLWHSDRIIIKIRQKKIRHF